MQSYLKYLSPISKHMLTKYNNYLTLKDFSYMNVFRNKFYNAFTSDINAQLIMGNEEHTKNTIITFTREINNVDHSKLEQDVIAMHNYMCLKLKNEAIINIVYNDQNTIAAILHSINTFCSLFPSNYEGLNIYISIDDNHRNIVCDKNDEFFECQKMKSAGFCVSGLTNSHHKTVIITKKDEIIKLIFHELIHYIGLDSELRNLDILSFMDTEQKYMNIAEAYTELISITLCAMYESIHLLILTKKDLFNEIMSYEIDYSYILSSQILKFYGYDKQNYNNFFIEKKFYHKCPVYIWDYVITRCILTEMLPYFVNINFRLSKYDIDNVIKYLSTEKEFSVKLEKYMDIVQDSHIPYIIVDLDWSQI
jgi:hypothetical protein